MTMTADLALLGKSSATETVIENRIFIGGIPPHADETDFRNFLTGTFEKYMIKDVKIIFDRTGASKGYGFITFDSKDIAQKILNSSEYENLMYKERKLNISKAVKKYPKPNSIISPASVMPNSGGHVQYVLLQGQDGLSLGYTPSMLQLQQYGYGPAFYLPHQNPYPYAISSVGGAQNGNASASAMVSQNAPHVQCQIPWGAAAGAATLPGHQLQFLSPAAAAAAAAPGLPCFSTGARSAGGDLLYYSPTAFNSSMTSDYSSCSDPNSLDAGTDSESSPARANPGGDCFSPGLMPYSPAQPLYQYAQVKGHQAMQCLPNPQQPRLMMTAAAGGGVGGGVGNRGEGRLKYGHGMEHGHGN